MPNSEVIEEFLACYQKHDAPGMLGHLDDRVRFSDYAFDIRGEEVKAMWQWFCVPFGSRQAPIEVLGFGVSEQAGDSVKAWYKIRYLNGLGRRPVEYTIESEFRIQNGRIVAQQDRFGDISESNFLKMAFGFPENLRVLIPVAHTLIRIIARIKLKRFMLANKVEPACITR